MQEPTSATPRPKRSNGPSMALSLIFATVMTLIVAAVIGFVIAFTMGSQAGVNFFIGMLKWVLIGSGVVAAYGFAVGLYHTFLSITGLDRGRAKTAEPAEPKGATHG